MQDSNPLDDELTRLNIALAEAYEKIAEQDNLIEIQTQTIEFYLEETAQANKETADQGRLIAELKKKINSYAEQSLKDSLEILRLDGLCHSYLAEIFQLRGKLAEYQREEDRGGA